MKRGLWAICLWLALLLAGCGGKEVAVSIEAPPGSQGFVYSHEEVAGSGKIELSCGKGLGDTEAVLLPVDDTPPVQPVYLTPGMPVAVKVEKGKWYKVGVNLENSGDEALRVFVKVRGAEVRIE